MENIIIYKVAELLAKPLTDDITSELFDTCWFRNQRIADNIHKYICQLLKKEMIEGNDENDNTIY